jgi:putative transposase
MDFMSDGSATGQRIRVFTLVDAYTRECVALDAAAHFSGRDVAQILTRVGSVRRLRCERVEHCRLQPLGRVTS